MLACFSLLQQLPPWPQVTNITGQALCSCQSLSTASSFTFWSPFSTQHGFQRPRFYTALCAMKTSQVTGMASGLTLTVLQLPSLLFFKQNVYTPHSEPLLLWHPLPGCSLCLWSFTQFGPSLNSSFIKIAYPVTAAYHRKAPHSWSPMVSSPSFFFLWGISSHALWHVGRFP